MHTLYSMQNSGNCYKLRLAMAQLGIPFRLVDIDIFRGESRTPAFLALNPDGKVPFLQLADGTVLTESNACLFYLAEGTALLPQDRFERAQVLQWMFFEQYSHEPYIAVARYWLSLVEGGAELMKDRLPKWTDRGHQALRLMDRHLAQAPFFAAGRYSIADIALYAYTHMAHEGGFDLSGYSNLRAWLDRVADQPGHVTMDYRPD